MKASSIIGSLIVLVVSLHTTSSFAVGNEKTYSLKGEASIGRILRPVIATSPIPFDKSYVELTNDQQAKFKRQFRDLSVDDRPPFPAKGLVTIYKPILTKNKSLADSGNLRLAILVDEKGRVDNITVVETPSAEMARYVSEALVDVTFEPAICGGEACSMKFPVELVLK